MPFDRFVLILVAVVAAAGCTIWAAAYLLAGLSISPSLSLIVAILVGLLMFLAFRVIAGKFGRKEDKRHDI